MELTVHEISEIVPGVFGTLLAPCSCQVLAHLLLPVPSFVWLDAYHPHGIVEWVDLPLPLAAGAPAKPVRARLPRYDLQFPLAEFLTELPQMHARSGMLAMQMSRPVPNTLVMEHLADNPSRRAILAQNGWLFSFDLPHDGEYAWVETPHREHLERVLSTPIFMSRDLP
jgi:hypothetical protein